VCLEGLPQFNIVNKYTYSCYKAQEENIPEEQEAFQFKTGEQEYSLEQYISDLNQKSLATTLAGL